jgi:hypothetical protein
MTKNFSTILKVRRFVGKKLVAIQKDSNVILLAFKYGYEDDDQVAVQDGKAYFTHPFSDSLLERII